MPRGPAKVLALLLVLWIVAVVILPTIDLPHTTLPTRSGIRLGGLIFFGAILLWLLPKLTRGADFLAARQEQSRGCGRRDVINLTCSRLC